MSSRNAFASILMAGLLAVGFVGVAPVADGASAGQSVRKSRESARTYVLESKRSGRRRGTRIHLPIGPAYIYYDYPYYYSRGHYPTHIGGYVYYVPRYVDRCSNRHRSCVAKGGHNRGAASSRRQRRACGC